jgi:hypothetical protein
LGGEVSGNYNIMDANRKSGAVVVAAGGLTVCNLIQGGYVAGTTAINSGKYYWEVLDLTGAEILGYRVGLTTALPPTTPSQSSSYLYAASTGCLINPSNVSSSYGTGSFGGDVIGVAFDADEGRLYFALNGVWQNSGNPVTSVNPAFTSLTAPPYYVSIGGDTASVAPSVVLNFGQYPWEYTAPTGYGPLVSNDQTVTLTFDNNTNLTEMVTGDSVAEVGGDASGKISAVSASTNSLTVSFPLGTWTVGSKLVDNDQVRPAPAPTSDPPDPSIYTLVANVTGSVVDLTSFAVGKPPLDPLVTYYTRVQYTSDAPITTSLWSSYNKITTGTLT